MTAFHDCPTRPDRFSPTIHFGLTVDVARTLSLKLEYVLPYGIASFAGACRCNNAINAGPPIGGDEMRNLLLPDYRVGIAAVRLEIIEAWMMYSFEPSPDDRVRVVEQYQVYAVNHGWGMRPRWRISFWTTPICQRCFAAKLIRPESGAISKFILTSKASISPQLPHRLKSPGRGRAAFPVMVLAHSGR